MYLPGSTSASLRAVVVAAICAGLVSSPAYAAHPYFLAATIDDPLTVQSVCQAQAQIAAGTPTDTVTPHATSDLHVSLVVFGDSLSTKQKAELKKIIGGVVSGLKKYGPIKLAGAIKSANFAVFNSGYVVYAIENPGILKTIANASRNAVEVKQRTGIEIDPRDDFGRNPNAHMSFGTFDKNGEIGGQKTSIVLRRKFIPFPQPPTKGQVIVDPPDATRNWVLHEINLKHNEGGHYVNVETWVLPDPGPAHPAPQPCSP